VRYGAINYFSELGLLALNFTSGRARVLSKIWAGWRFPGVIGFLVVRGDTNLNNERITNNHSQI
jgi:hypothetical protein